jgi:UvrD/REP helicase N-terminal domain
MARMIPNAPVGPATSAHLRVYRLLKALPETDFTVWQRLPAQDTCGLDFWVLGRNRRALFLKISTATPHDVAVVRQAQLFGPQKSPEIPGCREQAEVDEFMAHLAKSGQEIDSRVSRIPCAILFPNLAKTALEQVLAREKALLTTWGAREIMPRLDFLTWLNEHLSAPLAPDTIDTARQILTPEVVIPPSCVTRRPPEPNTRAGVTPYLLDYRQEEILKADLDLPDEAREFNLRLVNGVAGSGKSLIIVYRARLLRQLFPAKRFLVLTHGRPSIHDLQARYQHLMAGDKDTEWHTFMAWCRHYWPKEITWPNIVTFRQRREITSHVCQDHLSDTAISGRMLLEEIDWFKDRMLFDRSAYLDADRTGRGFHLVESIRQRVYDAMEAYHRELGKLNCMDWGDVPRHMLRALDSKQVDIPAYDAILVDEAQFFAPIWFNIIKQILKPVTGTLFMVADPTQGFLKRKQSWVASGLEVRGHAHRMDKSYRTTRQILDFATLLYRTRLPREKEKEDLIPPDLLDMPGDTMPTVIPLTSPQDELSRVVNEIEAMVKAGVPLADILVIHADWRETDRLIARLQQRFGPDTAAAPGRPEGDGYLRVCSLNAATGLESPIVILMGVHALYEEEQSIRVSEGERAELIRDNTRKLYRACTRAGRRLMLTYIGELPEIFKGLGRT